MTTAIHIEAQPSVFHGEQALTATFELTVDTATQLVLNALISKGLRPLIVGGAVRDALLSKPSKDFDIEVHGAESFTELTKALKPLGRLNLTGKSFGVLKMRVKLPNGGYSEEVDLSLPRRDSKTGVGHRGFTVEADPTMTLLEATSRRDLTINALAWDPASNLIIDMHGGLQDLQAGVLRHVTEAFSEDPLRVLRVARFAAKLGFKVADSTLSISRQLSGSFHELPSERITGELARMLQEEQPEKGFSFLQASDWSEELGLTFDAHLTKELKQNRTRLSPVTLLASIAVFQEWTQGSSDSIAYFARNSAELKRAKRIAATGGDVVTVATPEEARHWAWANREITAAECFAVAHTVTPQLTEELEEAATHFTGVLDGPEADAFDSRALIAEHRAAHPELPRNGFWIQEVLAKARAAQYAR